jgi:hypothetical protein
MIIEVMPVNLRWDWGSKKHSNGYSGLEGYVSTELLEAHWVWQLLIFIFVKVDCLHDDKVMPVNLMGRERQQTEQH